MSRSARIGLAISIVFLVLIGVGYSQLEWVEKKIDEGYGEEARQNEFLAAELFLQEQGRSTETVTGMALLDNLPPPGDVLFLSASRESLSVRRRDALISWVRSGGALLIVAHDVYDAEAGSSEDPLLDELGIFLLGPDEEGATESEEEEEGEEERVAETDSSPPSEDEAAPDAEETAAVEERDSTPKTLFELLDTAREPELCWTDSEQLSVISTSSYGPISLELSGQNELAVTDEQLDDAYFSSRYQMLTMPFGEGRIVALTSIAPFRNQRVHCQDHAFFLWFAMGEREKMWLLHDPDVPSLIELAWREFPGTTAGGLLLVVLFVAGSSLRFGVARVEDEAPRRELREHLEASVTFQFRKGGFSALFERLRDDLIQRGPHDRVRWAKRAGLRPESADQLFDGAVPWKRREILKRVQIMLRMRSTK